MRSKLTPRRVKVSPPRSVALMLSSIVRIQLLSAFQTTKAKDHSQHIPLRIRQHDEGFPLREVEGCRLRSPEACAPVQL